MKQIKQFFLRFLLVSIILSVICINLYPRLLLNKGESLYETESTIEGSIAGVTGMVTTDISSCIIYGAGSFLNSHSAALNFLNKIEMAEMAGLNFVALRETLFQAIKNMERAKNIYTGLVEIASITPYNPSIIERLKRFEYEGFHIRNGMNAATFKKVEQYLSKGDVTGLFAQVASDSETILDMLCAIKEIVDKDQVPFNKELWKLAQAYSEFHMFGQYTAQVFYEVTGYFE